MTLGSAFLVAVGLAGGVAESGEKGGDRSDGGEQEIGVDASECCARIPRADG